MQYDIRLTLHYDYDAWAGGGRHQVRVLPSTIFGIQRVVAATLSFSPSPTERSDFLDFFGTNVTAIVCREAHDTLDVKMSARVIVSRPDLGLDVSPDLPHLHEQVANVLSLAADSPQHFLGSSDHAGIDREDYRLCRQKPRSRLRAGDRARYLHAHQSRFHL